MLFPKNKRLTFRVPEFSNGQFWRQTSEDDVIVTLRRRTCCTLHVFALCGKLPVFLRRYIS